MRQTGLCVVKESVAIRSAMLQLADHGVEFSLTRWAIGRQIENASDAAHYKFPG